MKLFETSEELRTYTQEGLCKSIGFVPTMGNLHQGHFSLIEHSKKQHEKTLVSIFVNPTQFNDQSDFKNYPKTLSDDLSALAALKVDACFLPSVATLYPDDYQLKVSESILSQELEGKHRAGHFDGVLTVVLKLLNLANASHAYFGEKDYQQYLLIKKLAEAFFLPTKILSRPTIREPGSHLALSSRNNHLTADEKALAIKMADIFHTTDSITQTKQAFDENQVRLDYLEERFGRRFIAFFIGEVRLIDNYNLSSG
jgi:pantoate--beta-alanine ligase